MCVSSNLTCGSCLAKWTGKSWEDSYKCVLSLKTWSPVLNKKFELCVEGQCDLDFTLEVCIPITNRLNSLWVSSDAALAKIHGRLKRKNLPDYIAKKFSNGIPSDWKEITNKWKCYIQQGEKSSFFWEPDDSFLSSIPTSYSSLRNRRNVLQGEDKDTRTKEKTPNRKQPHALQDVQSVRDSAFPSSDSKLSSSKQSPMPSALVLPPHCPWLHPDKVKEITSWIDHSRLTSPESMPDTEIDASRDSITEVIEKRYGVQLQTSQTSENTSFTENSISKVSELEAARENNLVILQSTPVDCVRDPRIVAEALNFNVSAIVNASQSDFSQSSNGCTKDNVFRIPGQGVQVPKTHNSKKDLKSTPNVTATSVPKTPRTRTRPQPSAKTSELPGSQIARMESTGPLRPRRKQSSQKLERWRPVLGVDGNLKVQGYLLLGGDMTAGQILTTNSVVQWGNRKVHTCDGREFELVGDSYGKIPAALKQKLLNVIDCNEIIEELKEFQALRDRADWGAEYEYFYEDDKSYGNTQRVFQGQRSETRGTRQIPSPKQKQNIDIQVINSQERSSNRRPFGVKLAKANASAPSFPSKVSQSITRSGYAVDLDTITNHAQTLPQNSSYHSPLRKSARIERKSASRKGQNEQSSVKNLKFDSAESSCISSSTLVRRSVRENHVDKQNSSFLSSDVSSGNIKQLNIGTDIWKNFPNQMMMPSPCLQTDSTIVHFSPSRIKVSYMEKSGQSIAKTAPENSQFRTNDLNTSVESLGTRPSRTPVKRSCLPCCQGPGLTTRMHAQSAQNDVSLSLRKRIPERVTSQSPVQRLSTHQSTMSSPRSSSAPIPKILGDAVKKATKSCMATPSSRSPRSSKKINSAYRRQPRVLLQRLEKLQRKTSPKKNIGKEEEVPKNSKMIYNSPAKEKGQYSLRVAKKRTYTYNESTDEKCEDEDMTYEVSSSSEEEEEQTVTKEKETNARMTQTERRKQMVTKEKKREPRRKQIERRKQSFVAKMKRFSKEKQSGKKTVAEGKQSGKKTVAQEKQSGKKTVTQEKQSDKKTAAKGKQSGKIRTTAKKEQDSVTEEKRQTVAKKMISVKKSGRSKDRKTTTRRNLKGMDFSKESEDGVEDTASVSSRTSDISVGPSASVICQMNAEPSDSRRAPRTLKERRERDEELAKLGRRLAARGALAADDDPMADLIASQKYSIVPQEWCSHEAILRQNARKRRRPSSSEGTVSPSRSGVSDGYGYEDAASSVATPQLLMRKPDEKQVQSYLQRQRALSAKPQRPTRQVRLDRTLILPHIDYSAAFRKNTTEDSSSEATDSDWED